MTGKVEKQREELARILDNEEVKVGNANWSTLLREGVIIKVHVHRWRSKVRLNWGDLGIYFDDRKELDTVTKHIRLGQQNLLPARYIKQLDSLETKVRQSLDRYSYNIYWGKFVPVKAYPIWKSEFEIIRDTYMDIAYEIVENYEAIRQEVISTVRQTYGILYTRLLALNRDMGIDSLSNLDREEFIENAVRKVEDHFRSKRYIQESFDMGYDLEYVPLLSDMTEDMEKAKQLEMETTLIQDDLAWKRQLMLEMNRDVVSKTREKYEAMVEEILIPISQQMRGMIYDATFDVLESIRNKKNLNSRNIVQLKTMIDKVNAIEFTEDREVKAILRKLESSIVDLPAKNRDLQEIDSNLRDINTILKASLMSLGEERVRQSRLLSDIPEDPSEDLVREARDNLNLDSIIEIEDMYREQRFNLEAKLDPVDIYR